MRGLTLGSKREKSSDGDTRGEQRDGSSHLRRGDEPGDINFLDHVFTQDYTAHFPGKAPIVGLKECKKAIAIFLAAFPDAVYKIEDLIAEGDRVVARWSAKGTHKGPFQGIPAEHMVPPTGKPVSFGATDIYAWSTGRWRRSGIRSNSSI